MRGSVSMDEAFMLSNEDRELISDIVKSNYENTKKSGRPLV